MKSFFNISCIFVLLLSCGSTTIIKLSDRKAKIYENEQLLGQGEIIFTSRNVAWSSRKFVAKKKGCQDVQYTLKRNHQVDWLALITGLFTFIPLVWVMEYDAVTQYEFTCLTP